MAHEDRPDRRSEAPASGTAGATYRMRLFIAGKGANSVIAEKNIRNLCARYLKQDADLTVIDVFHDYLPAVEENILVTPALVVDAPCKVKIFGNLQDTDKVLSSLGLL